MHHLVGDVDGGGRWGCAIQQIAVISAQFFNKSKTALKNKVFFKNKTIHRSFLLLPLRNSVACLIQWPLGSLGIWAPVWAVNLPSRNPRLLKNGTGMTSSFLTPSGQWINLRHSPNKEINADKSRLPSFKLERPEVLLQCPGPPRAAPKCPQAGSAPHAMPLGLQGSDKPPHPIETHSKSHLKFPHCLIKKQQVKSIS